ncbi:hypothetical protein bcgnr5378_05210 [Bacillus cereus]|uniref:Uncharacterized protein n=1 Tax=Bacillus cereus TaxID=1396 RepID=A0A161TPH2_BACCE|nr:hypothetical protein [Bacillus cereus]KZD55698.1 hypothetical protein B4088_5443 [Bacillus cereus]
MKQNVFVSGVSVDTLYIPDYIRVMNPDNESIVDIQRKANIQYLFCSINAADELYDSLFEIGCAYKRKFDAETKIWVVVNPALDKKIVEDVWFGLEMADEVFVEEDVLGVWDRLIKAEECRNNERFHYILDKKKIKRIKTVITEFCNSFVENKPFVVEDDNSSNIKENPVAVDAINEMDRYKLADNVMKNYCFKGMDFPLLREDVAKQIDYKLPQCFLSWFFNKKKEWDVNFYGFIHQFDQSEMKQIVPNKSVNNLQKSKAKIRGEEIKSKETLTEKQLKYLQHLVNRVGLGELPDMEKLTKDSARVLIAFFKKRPDLRYKKMTEEIKSMLEYVGQHTKGVVAAVKSIVAEEVNQEPIHFIPFDSVSPIDKKEIIKSWGMNARKKRYLLKLGADVVKGELVGFEGIINRNCVFLLNDGSKKVVAPQKLSEYVQG